MLPEQDGALRVTGVPLPRISDLAHAADVRLWELSPHQASLEEAYMRMTQGAVDYRSTADQRAGLQEAPAGYAPQGGVPHGGAPQGTRDRDTSPVSRVRPFRGSPTGTRRRPVRPAGAGAVPGQAPAARRVRVTRRGTRAVRRSPALPAAARRTDAARSPARRRHHAAHEDAR